MLTYVYSVAEESIYLCAQNGVSLGDMVQQRQRREWGIGFVPSFHPSSSALASMMEQSWLPPSPTIFSLYSTPCYPTPESLFYDDYSPMPSNLLDLLSDGGFESVGDPESMSWSTSLILTTLRRLRNIQVSIPSADGHRLIRCRFCHRDTARSRPLHSNHERDIKNSKIIVGWPSKSRHNRTNQLRYRKRRSSIDEHPFTQPAKVNFGSDVSRTKRLIRQPFEAV